MPCVFCEIIKGRIPYHKVYEDEKHLAFLDIAPSTKGQTLIVPKKHGPGYVFEMSDEEYCGLFLAAKRVANAIDRALCPVRTCMVLEGFAISDHIHVRLHPCFEKHLELAPMPKPTDAEFREITKKIVEAIK
jgi:diadenosine tetraphosphate (Ap4A) HIT family hydrolase